MKKKIIIFIGFFLPGINSGGPVRTIHNLINAFSKDADFYIVTHFSDKNEKKQYENILLNEWNNIYSCHIFYTNMNRLNKRIIMDLCKGKDAIYVCGCYDKYSRLILSLTKKKKLNNVFIASMGNFSRGALNIKSFKKKCYFAYLKVFGLTKRIIWSVSNEIEKKQVQTIFPNSKTIVASDIPSFINDERTKKTNEENIQILFVGRISRIKNLHFALKVLSYVKSKTVFSIIGPIEDTEYWKECKDIISLLPDNISVNYCGVLNYESINRAFLSNDVFLFPTLGENFGHVVFESMSAGCVPIISNKTPWQFPEDCGYIFECNSSDIEKMAIEIDYLCKHKNKLHMISNNSRKWSFEKYKNIIESSGYKEIIGEQDV